MNVHRLTEFMDFIKNVEQDTRSTYGKLSKKLLMPYQWQLQLKIKYSVFMED